MAEAVGLVASGISIGTLAVQITVSLNKLRSYWNQVKDAPQTLISLIEDIESLNSILTDMEDDQARNPISSMLLDRTSSSRCLEQCRKAAKRLQDLVDDLSRDLGSPSKFKKLWASNRAVLKKDKLDEYKAKLESTVRILTLSHQYYTSSLIQLQPDIILARISQRIDNTYIGVQKLGESSTDTIIKSPNHAPALKRCARKKPEPQTLIGYLLGSAEFKQTVSNEQQIWETPDKKRRELYLCLRAPTWLIEKSWEVQARHALHGWEFTFSSRRVHLYGSLVNRIFSEDDSDQLKLLFRTGEASTSDFVAVPYCVSDSVLEIDNQSMLSRAMWSGSLNICKLLLDCGVAVDDQSQRHLGYLTSSLRLNENHGHATALSLTYRMASSVTSIDISDLYSPISHEQFRLLKKKCYPEYYDNNISQRVTVAHNIAVRARHHNPKFFQEALSPTQISSQIWDAYDIYGNVLLTLLCEGIGGLLRAVFLGKRSGHHRNYSEEKGWLQLLHQAITQTDSNEHQVGLRRLGLLPQKLTPRLKYYCYSKTPLLALLGGILSFGMYSLTYDPMSMIDEILENVIFKYLTIVKTAGVDLEKYGRQEKELYRIEDLSRTFICRPGFGGVSPLEIGLIGFVYGPNPEDWKFWFSQPRDEWAGEFWYMIENPWENMIGAWVD